MDTTRTPQSREALLEAFNRAGRRGSAAGLSFSSALAGHLGLDRTAVECLDLIAAEGTVSAGRLGELTGLSSGAVTGLVDRLEDHGLVTRHPDPRDRRRLAITAAEEPPPQLTEVYGPFWNRLVELLEGYSDDELDTYNRLANDLADLVFDHAQQVRAAD